MKTCPECKHENSDSSPVCSNCGESCASVPPDLDAPSTSLSWEFIPLKPGDQDSLWVTLLSCRTLWQADLAVAHLQAAGIPAFLPDEFLMQAVSWNVNTYGFVRVQVSPQDHAAAQEHLSF